MVGSSETNRYCVVVPIKRFANAKKRLAGFLTVAERETLARSMAVRVLHAADGLHVLVVTDDDEVSSWARSLGADVVRESGGGLNAAVRSGVDAARLHRADRVIVIHADIPLATALDRFTTSSAQSAVIVPDTRNDGTNVLVFPADAPINFCYGVGSFAMHHRELVRLGFDVIVVPDAQLGSDVDHPRDLRIARAAGLWPLG